MSLTLDGVTGAVQERMKTEYQSKPAHMMYYVNLWSCFILSTGMYYKSLNSNYSLLKFVYLNYQPLDFL